MCLLRFQLDYLRDNHSLTPTIFAGQPGTGCLSKTPTNLALPILPRHQWATNFHLDILVSVLFRGVSVRYLPSQTFYPFFLTVDFSSTWITILCIRQHWVPFMFDFQTQTFHLLINHLTTADLQYVSSFTQNFKLQGHSIPVCTSGWCGYHAILILCSWMFDFHVTNQNLRTLRHLQQCFCAPIDGPATPLRAGSPSPGPTDLDISPTLEPALGPAPRTDFSKHFTFSLTPQFLDTCHIPDLTYYTTWNTLDPTCFSTTLANKISQLPFTPTHHLHLGLSDVLEARLDELLQPDNAHQFHTMLDSVAFQTYCPFSNKLFYKHSLHNLIGIVLHIHYKFTSDTHLYVLLLRPSCLASDFCNHVGREIYSNGIVFVIVPKTHTTAYPPQPYSTLVLLRCSLLRYQDALWTTFSPPPSNEIAYELPLKSSSNIIDLFSGIGTWNLASMYLSEHHIVCAVDNNNDALLTQATTFHLPLHTLTSDLYTTTDQPFLLCHDITDLSLLSLFSLLSPTLLCASPPCPPWSNAGTQQGFNRPEGNLTLFCLFYSYLLQTPVVLEQVSAFLDHPHYPIFSLVAQLLGLTFKFVQSTNAIAHVPVSRNRVLLCCEPGHNTPRGYLPPWHFHLRTPTLQASHYLPSDSPHLLDDALTLNSEELETLRDPTLVPSWYPLPSAPALQRRLRSIGDTLGAIMSSYPRQTSLPSSLLRTNGLYTELVSSSPSHVRRFHPLEWMAALGWPSFLCLPHDLSTAWHQLGNTLTPHQALFGLCAALSDVSSSYDFVSLLGVLLSHSTDLRVTAFHVADGFLRANSGSSFLREFVPPTLSRIHSIQNTLYHAPRNLLFRTPTAQCVVSYHQHETFHAFCKRCGIFPSSISSPLRSVILPSATMAQLFFQHRFLNSARPFSPPVGAFLLPPNFIAPYPRPTPGTFYLLDDPISRVCIVNWTLGDATGSYHTTSRLLAHCETFSLNGLH